MSVRSLRSLAGALVCVAIVACGGGSGPSLESSSVVDAGAVHVGTVKAMPLELRNPSGSDVLVSALALSNASAGFLVNKAGFTVPAHGSREVQISFAPIAAGAREATLDVLTPAGGSFSVQLRGEGAIGRVVLDPEQVDFGLVAVGDLSRRTVRVANEGKVAEEVAVSALRGASAFRIESPATDGRLVLEPGASQELSIIFAPNVAAPDGLVETLEVRPCTGCALRAVELQGRSFDPKLVATPDALVFPDGALGQAITKTVEVRNDSALAFVLRRAEISAGREVFRVDVPAQEIPARSSLQLPVTFTPREHRTVTGTLVLTTSAAASPSIEIPLTGGDLAPALSVSPTPIDFGEVVVGARRVRQLRVANTGVEKPLQLTRVQVRSLGVAFGIQGTFAQSVPAGGAILLDLAFVPSSSGGAEAQLVLETNDPDRPAWEVPLRGVGRVLPPCSLVLRPADGVLDFGQLPPGRSVAQALAVTNTGTDECLLDGLVVEGAPAGVFSIAGVPASGTVLGAGKTLQATVTFAPAAEISYAGRVRVLASEASPVERVVSLSGLGAQSCLAVSEPAVDFGTGPLGCLSSWKLIRLENTCTLPLTVRAVRSTAGTPANAHALTPWQTLPFTLQRGGEGLTLSLRARSQADAELTGLAIETDERTQPLLVPVRARASQSVLQEEAFVGRPPRVDVLLLARRALATGPQRTLLEQQLRALVGALQANSWDWQIGLASGDVSDARGKLLPLSGAGSRLIDALTPDPAATLVARLAQLPAPDVVNSAPVFDAAARAVAPSMLQGHNAGLLRPEAFLLVVGLSEREEAQIGSWITNELAAATQARGLLALGSTPVLAQSELAFELSATNGQAVDLASGDLRSVLAPVRSLLDPISSIHLLRARPSWSTPMQVRRDGVLLPQFSSNTLHWLFDTQANMLRMQNVVGVEPGKRIDVTYAVECD